MITHWKIDTLASIQLDRNKIFVTSEHTLVHKIKINSRELHLYLNVNKSASYDHLMNMIKITWNIAGHGDFVLQHQLWWLTRQIREEETESLYARQYKSQDKIETFLTALLHLRGRSEKNMKSQWRQPHSIRYLQCLPPCQLAPCLLHFALLTSVRFMAELFCSGVLNQHCVKWNSVRRDDVKWNANQWSMVTQCEVVWGLVRIGGVWWFWIRWQG